MCITIVIVVDEGVPLFHIKTADSPELSELIIDFVLAHISAPPIGIHDVDRRRFSLCAHKAQKLRCTRATALERCDSHAEARIRRSTNLGKSPMYTRTGPLLIFVVENNFRYPEVHWAAGHGTLQKLLSIVATRLRVGVDSWTNVLLRPHRPLQTMHVRLQHLVDDELDCSVHLLLCLRRVVAFPFAIVLELGLRA